jgi:hypothetical protein
MGPLQENEMSKPKLKTYRVTKRFEVWLEAEVKAADFAAATEAGKSLYFYAMMKQVMDEKSNANICDENEIAGFGVSESWD